MPVVTPQEISPRQVLGPSLFRIPFGIIEHFETKGEIREGISKNML
jgi:hypothetical protein